MVEHNDTEHEPDDSGAQAGEERKVVTGKSAQRAAAILDMGNIVAIIIAPLVIIWFGASMLLYAMNRHHPNPKVGYYTQWAAYRFYGVTGFFLAAATFIPGGSWNWYLYAWIAAIVIIVPWSLWALYRISYDQWEDVYLDEDSTHA